MSYRSIGSDSCVILSITLCITLCNSLEFDECRRMLLTEKFSSQFSLEQHTRPFNRLAINRIAFNWIISTEKLFKFSKLFLISGFRSSRIEREIFSVGNRTFTDLQLDSTRFLAHVLAHILAHIFTRLPHPLPACQLRSPRKSRARISPERERADYNDGNSKRLLEFRFPNIDNCVIILTQSAVTLIVSHNVSGTYRGCRIQATSTAYIVMVFW